MNIDNIAIPEELTALLRDSICRHIHAPYSGASTYRVEYENGDRAYLKILPKPHREPLDMYRDKLLWLNGKMPVPRVIHYTDNEQFEFLLMTEVEGKDATDPLYKVNTESTIRKLAQGLKEIHGADITDCPYDYTNQVRVQAAVNKTQAELIDIDKLKKECKGESYPTLCRILESGIYMEELVLTHGDYSVPNIIMNNGEISGFIDVADAGIADRYRDLAQIHRSIIRNFGAEWTSVFYDEYGIKLDAAKLKFYDVLEAVCCHEP